MLYSRRLQETEHQFQRERMLIAEREHQAIVRGSRLQFEVERAAEPLAQRESPGLVDPGAEGSMQDQLHAAAFVEEPLGDNRVLRRDHPERALSGAYVFGGLLRAPLVEAAIGFEDGDRVMPIRDQFAQL